MMHKRYIGQLNMYVWSLVLHSWCITAFLLEVHYGLSQYIMGGSPPNSVNVHSVSPLLSAKWFCCPRRSAISIGFG